MEKLNGDLHQPSGIRYESRSFSVGCLVSLAYREGFISRVNLSVVVPQAIGIYLRNRIGDSAGDVPYFSLGFGGTMCSIFLTCSLFLLVSMLNFIVCSSIDTPLYWFDPWPAFYPLPSLYTRVFGQKSHTYADFWPNVAYTRSFLAKICIYTQVFGQKSRIYIVVL